MKNIKEIFKLFKIDHLDKYDKYILMYNSNMFKNIENILPDHQIIKFKKDLEECITNLNNIDDDLYYKIYDEILELNDCFDLIGIDIPIYSILFEQEKNEAIKNNISKFRGYGYKSLKIKYNFNSTLTGRLTITEDNNCGNILTLPKRCRKIFKSSWNNQGSLISVDFKSLEPRIIKKITSNEIYEDIYETIKTISDVNVDRSIIKRAVISMLYGSELNVDYISKEKADELIKICNDFFDIDNVTKIAVENISKNSLFRKNYFGRPIYNLDETKSNIIMNNFIQSTAVDVALMYFYKLVNLVNKQLCKPVFIIHDAIVFDIHESYLEEFNSIIQKGYICPKLGYFPLEISDFINN